MLSSIVLLLLLLSCSAFFSGTETALFSLSSVELLRFKKINTVSATRLTEYLKQPRKLLVTILLGNEFVNVGISIVGASIIGYIFFDTSVETRTILAVLILTPIILVFGEISPKNIALRHAKYIAPVVIWPITIFYKIVRPLRVVLVWIADRVIILLGGDPTRTEPLIMEDEYRRLIDLGMNEGAIVEEERELIHNVFEFTDKVVGEIMTKAGNVFMLPADIDYKRALEDLRSVQYSRVPFYEKNVTNIIGVLYVKDLFSVSRKDTINRELELRSILHEPLFVNNDTPLEMLLREFQRARVHMAIVKGYDGEFVGVVTMDDVLEELFGEME